MEKVPKRILILVLAPFITIALSESVYAFHGGEGDVDYCTGCHVLHKPGETELQGTEEKVDTSISLHMLKGTDVSSTCLRCHAENDRFYSVFSKDGSVYSPGGDFYWLTRTFTWSVDGTHYQSSGDSHGHNIVAADYGLFADRKRSSAPGGFYPSTAMTCISCHDPHGKTGQSDFGKTSITGLEEAPALEASPDNYRLLGGVGHGGGSQAGGFYFQRPAPVAVGSSGDWTETDSNHTAYGSGMSEWCGNCHIYIITGPHRHPSGSHSALTLKIISNYNAYGGTGGLTGTRDTAYLALVPFELGTKDKSLLDPSSTSGPGGKGRANVMCLTCHRAHASAFPYIGRWDFDATFIADSHPRPGDGGATGGDILNSYYGRYMGPQFGREQRQLCNKCHLLD